MSRCPRTTRPLDLPPGRSEEEVRRADLIGHDVNIASRIAAVAGPGEVLLSEAIRQSDPERSGRLLGEAIRAQRKKKCWSQDCSSILILRL